MRQPNQTPEEVLKQILESYSEIDKEFWAFRGKAVREHAHAYFQYPAMMVPKMQGQLIRAVKEVEPSIRRIFDPFVGSGTTMTEAMMQGFDFLGQDINPLAILICRAKMGPFCPQVLQDKLTSLIEAIEEDSSSEIDIDFPGRDKWFQLKVAVDLSKIRRAIMKEQELWCRRFYWVALAETVRLSSNSRTSTFKLHIREEDDLKNRQTEIAPFFIFVEIAKRNLENLSKQKKILEENGLLERGHYRGYIEVNLGDSSKYFGQNTKGLDLLITSPPYGDNVSTVPYGQHSFLPLQWMDLIDIDEAMDKSWLKTTHEIDTRSLGGLRKEALEDTSELRNLSTSFNKFLDEIKGEPKDRSNRVAAFCRDLNRCIEPILAVLKPDAYMIWTVGNRHVAGKLVPVDQILVELLSSRGVSLVTKLERSIPIKRMALKNKIASTMRAETILVLRKG